MKKFFKVLSLVLVLTLVLLAPTFAVDVKDLNNGGGNTVVDNLAVSVGGTVTGILKTIGLIVAAIVVLWLAIQWMLAQPAKKAELKGRMWSILIGLILLVGGLTILDFIVKAGDEMANTLGN